MRWRVVPVLSVLSVLAACSTSPSSSISTSELSVSPTSLSVSSSSTSTPSSSTIAVTVPPVSMSVPSMLRVAAVGDSYTSGVGGGPADGVCGRSSAGWPELAAAEVADVRDGVVVSLSNVACSGAEIADVVEQLDGLGDVDVVLLTAGGNDAGFSELLATCAFSDCVAALEAAESTVAGFGQKLVALLEKAAQLAPVVVSTYPQVFDEGEGGVEACSLFTAAERAASRTFIDALNAGIGEAAAAVDGVSVVVPVFDGHGACSPEPWVVPPAVSGDTMHPNSAGYAAMAAAAVPLLTELGG